MNGGTGTGNYIAGAQVNVSANATPTGKQFAGWKGNLTILADPFSSTTTATMPSTASTITASYSVLPPKYALTVNGGSGDGTYAAGTVVKLTAEPPPRGLRFAAGDSMPRHWRINRGKHHVGMPRES